MIHKTKLTSILAAATFAAAAGFSPAMVAANDTMPEQSQPIPVQAEQFDEATIEAFAAAQVRVTELRTTYMPQIEAAQSEEQRAQIAEQANQEMVAAVEDTPNITLEEYDAVIKVANQNPALIERINNAIVEEES